MSRARALENIRVADFTWVRAGSWATRWLGAFGAEIIKIEWPENECGWLPSTTTPQHLEANLNTSGDFADTNVNKKSLSLNVRSAKGLEIVKRLCHVAAIDETAKSQKTMAFDCRIGTAASLGVRRQSLADAGAYR